MPAGAQQAPESIPISDRAVPDLRVPKSEGGRLMPPSWFLRFRIGQAPLSMAQSLSHRQSEDECLILD
jgi:hypothetical protein